MFEGQFVKQLMTLCAGLQLYPTLRMVWSVLLHIISQLGIDDNQCCTEPVMGSEATVSVSTIGIAVYLSWAMLFLRLICFLFGSGAC